MITNIKFRIFVIVFFIEVNVNARLYINFWLCCDIYFRIYEGYTEGIRRSSKEVAKVYEVMFFDM